MEIISIASNDASRVLRVEIAALRHEEWCAAAVADRLGAAKTHHIFTELTARFLILLSEEGIFAHLHQRGWVSLVDIPHCR